MSTKEPKRLQNGQNKSEKERSTHEAQNKDKSAEIKVRVNQEQKNLNRGTFQRVAAE